MRTVIAVEYNGAEYHGWQRQHGVRTIQGELEAALSAIADAAVQLVAAGRTDAGVHALGQIAHFDSDSSRPDQAWVAGANTKLSHDIRITGARRIEENFHARFSALARHYRYLIFNRRVGSGVYADTVTKFARPLDHDRMAKAARHLLGEHDFTSFRATSCQASSPVRTIHAVQVRRHGAFVIVDVAANGFLHHMVRNIAGVLLAIGVGDRPAGWIREVLLARDRTLAAVTAPATGLYLVGVDYPASFDLPEPSTAGLLFIP